MISKKKGSLLVSRANMVLLTNISSVPIDVGRNLLLKLYLQYKSLASVINILAKHRLCPPRKLQCRQEEGRNYNENDIAISQSSFAHPNNSGNYSCGIWLDIVHGQVSSPPIP